MVSVFLCMAYFTQHHTLKFHPCCYKGPYFVLSHCPVVLHCTHNLFFIHSSISGHLGCFHISDIVNNAALNIGCMYPLKLVFLHSLGKYSVVWLLGHRVLLFVTFWRTCILFSRVAAPVCIPTNSARGFPFLHILSSIYSLLICSF